MIIDFKAPESDKDYFNRLFAFIRRNLKLYILDFFLLFLLIIPPYTIIKTLAIFLFIVVLSVRDIVLLRLSKFHIQHLNISDNKMHLVIYKYSKLFRTYECDLSYIEIDSYDKLDFRIIKISKNNIPIIKQFPVGYWTNNKINELLYQLDNQKKQVDIAKMFK